MQAVAGTAASGVVRNDRAAADRKEARGPDGRAFQRSFEDCVKEDRATEKESKCIPAKNEGGTAKGKAAKSVDATGGDVSASPEPGPAMQSVTASPVQASAAAPPAPVISVDPKAADAKPLAEGVSAAGGSPAAPRRMRGNVAAQSSATAQIAAPMQAGDPRAAKEAKVSAPAGPGAALKPEMAATEGPVAPVVPGIVSHGAGTKISSRGDATDIASGARSVMVRGEEVHTLEAMPHALEVGLSAGAHGWLRVRAEMATDGEVSAQVIAGSAAAAAGLHKELPALTAFLADEKVGLTSLVVTAAERSSGTADAAMGSNAQGQERDAQSQARQGKVSAWDESVAHGDEEVLLPLAGMHAGLAGRSGNGGWLSVLA